MLLNDVLILFDESGVDAVGRTHHEIKQWSIITKKHVWTFPPISVSRERRCTCSYNNTCSIHELVQVFLLVAWHQVSARMEMKTYLSCNYFPSSATTMLSRTSKILPKVWARPASHFSYVWITNHRATFLVPLSRRKGITNMARYPTNCKEYSL